MKFLGHIAIIIFLVLVGCQDVQIPEPPENLLSKQKVAEVLADAYVSNATRSKGVLNRIRRAKGLQLDSMLYTKHGVDSLSFAVSNNYYASNLEVYTEIITEVEKLLTQRKAKLDSANAARSKRPKIIKDSVTPTSFQRPDAEELTESVQDEE